MKIITYKNTDGKGGSKLLQYYVADDGKVLSNGTDVVYAIPIESADGWTEVDAPAEDENATEADYIAALAELGVSE